MDRWSTIILMLLLPLVISGQWYQAQADESGQLVITQLPDKFFFQVRNVAEPFNQLNGFPKGFPADVSFKNFRNVALADLDGNGSDEILIGIDDFFTVWKADSLWWSFQGEGTFIYPPTVGDLDADGDLEIVQTTGGIPSSGKTYGWDHTGNELPGWPRTFDQNWILTAAALSDMDDDGQQEVILIERKPPGGRVHILNQDASFYGSGWPVTLPGTPATTPSIADIDEDGLKDIVVASTTVLYALDLAGNHKPGWPIENTATKFSFQSPILADLDGDGQVEVMGSTHGDAPEYYIFQSDATYYMGWPKPVPGNRWTFSPPTLVDIDNQWWLFMGRPIGDKISEEMLFAWEPSGIMLENFPIVKAGGNEGFIAIADVNGDQSHEVIFSSNIFDGQTGRGFIHAYNIASGIEIEGFPLRPKGWTYMNGATLGDVNGDGMLDLVALSYSQKFGEGIDSTFINVYEMETPIDEGTIKWGTYKGSNQRNGYIENTVITSRSIQPITQNILFPNPTSGVLRSSLDQGRICLYNLTGIKMFEGKLKPEMYFNMPKGVYTALINHNNSVYIHKIIFMN